MTNKQIKMFLDDIENSYDYEKVGGGYINVVGTKSGLFEFLMYANKHKIWQYRTYHFCTYYGTQFKGIFCKQEDLPEIKQFVDNHDNLCLNASNPFC